MKDSIIKKLERCVCVASPNFDVICADLFGAEHPHLGARNHKARLLPLVSIIRLIVNRRRLIDPAPIQSRAVHKGIHRLESKLN